MGVPDETVQDRPDLCSVFHGKIGNPLASVQVGNVSEIQ